MQEDTYSFAMNYHMNLLMKSIMMQCLYINKYLSFHDNLF